ncbi:MAG: outer membrane protein assembly factor BamA [Candidatus Dasytiphilus stammeri]
MNLFKFIGKFINSKKKKKFCIVLLLFFSPKVIGKDGFVVEELYFQGLHRITVKEASISLPIRSGDLITRQDISNTIRALFSSRQFNDIQILRVNNILILKVQERPLIASIKIYGNHHLSTKKIMKYLDQQGIQEGALFDPYLWTLIEENFEDYYYNNGEFTAHIKVIVKSLRHQRVGIRIVFSEGKSAIINNINILGNTSFSDKKLTGYLKRQENIFVWQWFVRKSQYERTRLIQALKHLSNFYLDRGYAHFYIASTQVFFTPQTQLVDVTIFLHEGKRYKINKVIIHCCDVIINQLKCHKQFLIKQGVGIRRGEWYKREKVFILESYLRKILKGYGYVWPTINTNLKFNDLNHSVQVWINVIGGQQYDIEKVFFKGNYITDNLFLRHKIGQFEGTRYNGNLIEYSRDLLESTGYFKSVNIIPTPVLETDDKVDLLYKFHEIKTAGIINFGVSYSTEGKVDYQTFLHQKNWLGEGYKVNFGGIKSNYKIHAEMTVTNPLFTIKNLKVSKYIYYTNIFRDYNETNFTEYKYSHRSYGFEENIAYPVWRRNFVNVGIGFNHNDISDISPQLTIWRYLSSLSKTPNLIYRLHTDNVSDNNLSFKLGLAYSNLLEKEFPKYGNDTQLNEKFYLPFSLAAYYQIIFDTVQYIPLSIKINNKMILLVQSHMGYSGEFGENNPSLFLNFNVGGLSSLRGFKVYSVGPKITYYDTEEHFCGDDTQICSSHEGRGGNIMTIGSIELFMPLKSWLGFMRSSIFIDFGTVWDQKSSNLFSTQPYNIRDYSDPNRILVSTGISFKWNSPLGSILLSYSQPLKNNRDDRIEKFQFSLGTSW